MRPGTRLLSALAAVLLLAAPAAAQQPLTSNYIRMVGANAGTSPSLNAFGTDASISIILAPKGAGGVQLGTGGTAANLTDANGNTWITETPSGSSVNNLSVSNAATGNFPTIGVAGTDANIGITFQTKGTGPYRLRGGTAAAQSAHLEISSSVPPVLSVCGTGTITAASNDMVGDVTATGATACTLTFNQPWTNAPFCFINDFTTIGVGRVSALSTTAFTVTAMTSGDRFQYHCLGRY